MQSIAAALRVVTFLLLYAVGSACYAADLDQAKQAGLVGETAEGYVALVESAAAPADLRALVDDVNARRRGEYQRIAGQNGIRLEQVEALAAQKAIDRTRAGGWVRIDGTWRQK